jgi:hypothetical protein
MAFGTYNYDYVFFSTNKQHIWRPHSDQTEPWDQSAAASFCVVLIYLLGLVKTILVVQNFYVFYEWYTNG